MIYPAKDMYRYHISYWPHGHPTLAAQKIDVFMFGYLQCVMSVIIVHRVHLTVLESLCYCFRKAKSVHTRIRAFTAGAFCQICCCWHRGVMHDEEARWETCNFVSFFSISRKGGDFSYHHVHHTLGYSSIPMVTVSWRVVTSGTVLTILNIVEY